MSQWPKRGKKSIAALKAIVAAAPNERPVQTGQDDDRPSDKTIAALRAIVEAGQNEPVAQTAQEDDRPSVSLH